jgi:NO-binding membrane sensor protein with MHYT domain
MSWKADKVLGELGERQAIGVFISLWLGVLAMKLDANLIVEPLDVAASLVVCALISVFMIWALFRVLQWKPHYEWLRVVSSLIFAGSLVGILHSAIATTHFEVLQTPSSVTPRSINARPAPCPPP